MTADATTLDDQPETLFCYRHPDRETWVRCGRCDRPICTKCAMLGPVGMRCKQCGRLKNDPLTSFTPVQLTLAIAVALGGGLMGGLIGTQLGFWLVILGPFIGVFITETIFRVVGFKHGPVIAAIVYGGIIAGALGGLFWQYRTLVTAFAGEDGFELPFEVFVTQFGIWTLIYAVAACIGARSRLR